MRFTDLMQLVISNLRRMVGRVVFTALGVVIGTGAIVILISLGAGLQSSLTSSLESFGAINQITVFSGGGGPQSGSDQALDARAIREFQSIPGVEAVTPRVSIGGTYQLNRLQGGATTYGIAPLAADDLGLAVERGTNRLSRGTIVVGPKVAEQFFDPRRPQTEIEPPDLFGQTLLLQLSRFDPETGAQEDRTVRLRVGGVLEETGGETDFNVYMALDDVEELTAWQQNGVSPRWEQEGYPTLIVITQLDPAIVQSVEGQIADQGYFAFSIGSSLQGLNTFFLIVQAALGGIGAIALLVAAIGIGNTMVMSVMERTREIGLMKAVGAHNRDVLTVFVVEAGIIGVLGGIVGVIAGWLLSLIINVVALAYISAQTAAQGGADPGIDRIAYTPLWLVFFAIGFAFLIGLIAGIFPALRAVQLDPVRALKYE